MQENKFRKVLRHTKESVLGRRVDFVYILDANVVALLCYLEKDPDNFEVFTERLPDHFVIPTVINKYLLPNEIETAIDKLSDKRHALVEEMLWAQ